MKKVFIILIILLIIAIPASIFIIKTINKDSRITNDSAEKDEQNRYLTIINKTEQIINKVTVTIGDGTEIEKMSQTNPDENSFSIKIPEQYDEYKEFTVTLIDRYDMVYQKEIMIEKEKGRTEVVIDKDNYVEQKGDTWHKINKFFNGD